MGAKRGLLIGVGTLGSLGAVLAITPPQFGASASGGLSGATTGTTTNGTSAATTTTAAAPAATTAAAPAATTPAAATTTTTKKKSTKKTTTKSSTATTSANATASTPAATATTAAPAPSATKAATSSGASGTYTGAVYQAIEPNGRVWGNVQVTVTLTLSNGVITAISGVQNPSSRGSYAFSQIDPYVQAHKVSISTITSTSADSLPYVSQATYSSIAYWESLQSALKKAGV